MTSDDERMIKGEAVEKLADAKRRGADLESRRDSMRKALDAARSILYGTGADFLTSEVAGIADLILHTPEKAGFPTAREIGAIVSGIEDVELEIEDLERRMKEFGI